MKAIKDVQSFQRETGRIGGTERRMDGWDATVPVVVIRRAFEIPQFSKRSRGSQYQRKSVDWRTATTQNRRKSAELANEFGNLFDVKLFKWNGCRKQQAALPPKMAPRLLFIHLSITKEEPTPLILQLWCFSLSLDLDAVLQPPL